jgi:ribonuclease E
MKKEMLINVLQPEECRIAIIEDGVLEELYVERTSHESYTGNIYKGRIVNIEPAIQAAFVDFSVGRNGFLHVSDVEPQYAERASNHAPLEEAEPSARPRERDRRRDPRRERGRGRERDPRRRARETEPFGPPDVPAPPPPRLEERPRDRPREAPRLREGEREREFAQELNLEREPEREPDIERERDADRPRERERPDLSVRGRRDRSEPPARRFGEGLIDPPEPQAQAPQPGTPAVPLSPVPLHERETPPSGRWPDVDPFAMDEPPGSLWGDISMQTESSTEFPAGPEGPIEPPSSLEQALTPFGEDVLPAEPVEPELPPSRTQRSKSSSRPGEGRSDARTRRHRPVPPPRHEPPEAERMAADEELEARSPEGFGELEPKKTRPRGRPTQPPTGFGPSPTEPGEDAPSPQAEPEIGPEELQAEADVEGFVAGPQEPPHHRGGRAAIRARGAEWGLPGESAASPEVDPGRSQLGSSPPMQAFDDLERARPASEPGHEYTRRRPPDSGSSRHRDRDRSRTRDRDRGRPAPHDRAGEPGYVPRRERQRERSGDEPTPDQQFSASFEWPETAPAPEVTGELEAQASEGWEVRPDEETLRGPTDFGRGGRPQRTEGRRRRRRRGRRRDRESGLPTGESPASSFDEPGAFYPDEPAELEPSSSASRSFGTDLPPNEIHPDLDEFDLDDAEAIDTDTIEDDDFAPAATSSPGAPAAADEIDSELEEEIRKEIEEIEELEREMGLRGPSEARPRRDDDSARGGRSGRGRLQIKPPIQELFRRGDEVLVQVIKESIGTKGPTLSTYISIPGRYLVLMPGLNRVGVSRKIIDETQRRKLRSIMLELNPPRGLGFIVRTAGLERTKRELARDLAYLLRLWKVILRRIKKSRAPTPIYQESDMIIRTIRDVFTSEIDTIWIDEPSAFERAQDFLRVVMPRFVNRLKLYDEKVPLFHKYGIEDEIAKIQRRHVPLPEGGSIVIDSTEALVAIDVNSGNFRVEDDAEKTAYEMNMRAAKEIARQLRLRDLGGVIVNDFIDMREERHRRGVERALREAIKRDRARTKILRMSAFGLIEMTRQRIRPSLKRSIYEDCPHCFGAGVVKTAESIAIDAMRLLALASHREEIRRVAVSVAAGVAAYLSNRKRRQIAQIESECHMSIQIDTDQAAPPDRLQIVCYDAGGNEVRLLPLPSSGHKRVHA